MAARTLPMTGGGQADARRRRIVPGWSSHADERSAFDREAGDLAVLDDVDAERIGAARIPQATASCRAMPPRRCIKPPWIG